MIKQVPSLNATIFAATVAVVLSAAGSARSAQEQSLGSRLLNLTAGSRQHEDSKNQGYLFRQKNPINPADSLNPDPFLLGPNPDFCISCTWPEGSSTYHSGNG
jgi:hypothetical protein